ncbi:MAG: hypothetical protein HGA33_03090 [Candidatus Moranbacteria bacterium]|nr:hypothetical protein [Candidatus Moranbacteria bacterium]
MNRKRIVRNYDAFMKSVSDIRALLPEGDEIDPKAVLDLRRRGEVRTAAIE